MVIVGKVGNSPSVDWPSKRGPASGEATHAIGRAPAGGRSHGLRPPPRSEQFKQIVREADQKPLRLHFAESSEREAPEAARALDLAEDRLDDRLTQSVDGLAGGSCQQE